MRKLFEISQAYQNVWDLVLDETMDLDLLDDALESIEGELTEKCENGIGLIRSLENIAESMEREAERLTVNRKAVENRVKRIKNWYMASLEIMGVKSVPTKYGTMSVNKAGGKRAIEITDEQAVIASGYFKEIPAHREMDKDALRAALEKGATIDGARLKPQGRYLKIK